METCRGIVCALALVGALVLVVPSGLRAAEPTPKPPHRHVAKKPAATTQAEREHREDLERRIERLEQRYEMKEPVVPPAEAPARRPAP